MGEAFGIVRYIQVECVLQYVTANDEWCAEGYMETDYTKIGIKLNLNVQCATM